jgi:hypothetical protein
MGTTVCRVEAAKKSSRFASADEARAHEGSIPRSQANATHEHEEDQQ